MVKSRGLARVVKESKCHSDSVLCITDTPLQLCPNAIGNKDALWIESEVDPHAEPFDPDVDRQASEIAEGQPVPPPSSILKGAR